MTHPPFPEGYNTINPMIISKDALKLIEFLKEVFGGEEDLNCHTVDDDGLLLHSELMIGNSRITIAETKPDWPYTPGLTQIYVEDIEAVLARAEKLSGEIVTKPTAFFGGLLSCAKDPFGNLWWIYQHNPEAEKSWAEAGTNNDVSHSASSGSGNQSWEPTEEMTYIHDTWVQAMRDLRA